MNNEELVMGSPHIVPLFFVDNSDSYGVDSTIVLRVPSELALLKSYFYLTKPRATVPVAVDILPNFDAFQKTYKHLWSKRSTMGL